MRYQGVSVVPGIAHGRLWAPPRATGPAEGGMEAFEAARRRFIDEAAALPDDLHAMYEAIVCDPTWDEGIARHLAAPESLSVALTATAREIAAGLEALDDPYLAGRGADFVQIGAQLIRLLGEPAAPDPSSILCARDVSAVELARWAPLLAGVVLIDVAPTAHIAIVARGLALPTVALGDGGADLYRRAQRAGKVTASAGLLNGFEGWLETAPERALSERYPSQSISAQPDPAPVLVGGRTVGVYANVNFPGDAPLAATLGADGIGLFRTEFLYVDRPQPPPFAEECAAYARVAAAFAGRPIVVRTLDLGGDKVGLGIEQDGLDHGMLGVRGIRSLAQARDVRATLRAILEGFAGADLRLMFPMISRPDEFRDARDLVREAARRCERSELPRLGIMLEVPAAAFALETFARDGASFVSLGTNDLVQYFFAVDRLSRATLSTLPPTRPFRRSSARRSLGPSARASRPASAAKRRVPPR